MTVLYNFINVQMSGLIYCGITSSDTTIYYDAILDTIKNDINDITKIDFYIDNKLILQFNKIEVYFVSDDVINRLWFCNSIYNKLHESDRSRYYINVYPDRVLSMLLYEMMKYASMLNKSMRIEVEQP